MNKKVLIIVLLIMILTACNKTNKNEDGSININVYVNDIRIDTIVYENTSSPKIDGPDNLSDYVSLSSLCEALGASCYIDNDIIYLEYNNKNSNIAKNEFIIINDKIFVEFSSIRYAINGSLKQNDYDNMYLYSKDFERLDIPATLEDCYKELDKTLDARVKRDIKKSESNLIDYHFSIGLWIRNNWLYQTDGRITKVLREAGINHIDDMSSAILLGYHKYLNGID